MADVDGRYSMKRCEQYNDVFSLLFALFIVGYFAEIPPFATLSDSAMLLLGIFLGSIFLWIKVGISWPSLFCLLALALIPEFSMNDLIATSIGNPAICFLIFTFCCSHALNQTPFLRRCAVRLLSTPFARKGAWSFLSLYFFSILILGSCISTTVLVVIYLSINESIFSLLQIQKGHRLAAMMTMGLVITASVSGAMTPIAHVFPLVALNIYTSLTGASISYLTYMTVGIPSAVLVTIIMTIIFRTVLKPDVSVLNNLDLTELQKHLIPMGRRDHLIVTIFFSVVALWVLPELTRNALPALSEWILSFGTAMPPILGTMLLCVFYADGKPLLSFEEGLRNVPWPSLLMGAAALALGSAMTDPDIGLSAFIGQQLSPLSQSLDGMALVLVLMAVAGIMTNIGSNMVTVTVLSTIVLPIALSMWEERQTAALAVVIGMMSSCAYATPPAMTTVALATGSGWTTNAQMATYGFLVLIPSIIIITFFAYPLAFLLLSI